ncbi:hypothetical protein Tco_0702098 [Tanacetum coccineum]|uniref:Uncharacterized protein n=1 Tax=Tanacetum coccineum TaxID=301880 RepID=A0ABQ4XVU0_9ASTR
MGIVPTEMELILEQTQQDSILQAGNPVKEILLNLNLPNHRLILTDSKIYIKMEWRYMVLAVVQDMSRFIATCSYSTDKCKDIMKAQVHVSRLPLL